METLSSGVPDISEIAEAKEMVQEGLQGHILMRIVVILAPCSLIVSLSWEIRTLITVKHTHTNAIFDFSV